MMMTDEAKPGQSTKPEPGKPGPGNPEPGEQVVVAPPGIGQQQQVGKEGGKEGGKKTQEEDHEFDVEGKSAVSGKKRTGWM